MVNSVLIPLGPSSTISSLIPVSLSLYEARFVLIVDRPMDVLSNTFCACGAQLGNGTWAIFGGNQRESLKYSC
jgi:hypothetical protein